MSLLTGDPRSATVVARGDVVVLELDAAIFRTLGAADPHAVEQVGVAAMTRRAELAQARRRGEERAVAEAPATFLGRMKRFLGCTSRSGSPTLPAIRRLRGSRGRIPP